MNLDEAFKLGNETRFAVLGRTLADAAAYGYDERPILCELAMLRQSEYEQDTTSSFAALARQCGDAVTMGRDTAPLVARLRDLRHYEVTGQRRTPKTIKDHR